MLGSLRERDLLQLGSEGEGSINLFAHTTSVCYAATGGANVATGARPALLQWAQEHGCP